MLRDCIIPLEEHGLHVIACFNRLAADINSAATSSAEHCKPILLARTIQSSVGEVLKLTLKFQYLLSEFVLVLLSAGNDKLKLLLLLLKLHLVAGGHGPQLLIVVDDVVVVANALSPLNRWLHRRADCDRSCKTWSNGARSCIERSSSCRACRR